MDLQMWMPLSLTRLARMTSKPLALRISDKEKPKKLFRRCPKCRGLLVLGELYSTITFCPLAGSCPSCSSCTSCWNTSNHFWSDTEIFRKPFTTLKLLTMSEWPLRYAPIWTAPCSGDVLVILE